MLPEENEQGPNEADTAKIRRKHPKENELPGRFMLTTTTKVTKWVPVDNNLLYFAARARRV